MADEQPAPLATLERLRQQGVLSEAEYQAIVAGMKAASYQAETTAGAISQGSGDALAQGAVIARDVQGSIK